jgi:hypothetical protein
MSLAHSPSGLAPRSVTMPLQRSFATPYPFAPFDNVAGFSANQLSIPAPHQAQLMSNMYNAYSTPSFSHNPAHSALHEVDNMRADSPELIDISAAPVLEYVNSVSATAAAQIPMSFDPPSELGMGQAVIYQSHQTDRLHSAPLLPARFHSSLEVPTANNWNNMAVHPKATSADDTQAFSGSVGGQEQGVEASGNATSYQDVATDKAQCSLYYPNVAQEDAKIQLLTRPLEGSSLWGEPAAYPRPPEDQQLRIFSSSSSTTSTSSTLVEPVSGQLPHGLTPLTMLPAQSHPTGLPYPTAFPVYPTYPTPVTPWSGTHQQDIKLGYGQPMYQPYLLSPAIVMPRQMPHTYEPTPSPIDAVHHEVHDITLATPNAARTDRNTMVQDLGLGLANVNFHRHSSTIPGPDPDGTGSTGGFPSDNELEEAELDEGEISDSDDEFVPTGRGRPRRKSAGQKKRKGRGFTTKPRKKSQCV